MSGLINYSPLYSSEMVALAIVKTKYLIDNHNAISTSLTALNSNVELDYHIRNAVDDYKFVVDFDITKLDLTISNQITIESNALILWNSVSKNILNGWNNKVFSSLLSEASYYLLGTYVSSIKDYELLQLGSAIPNDWNDKFILGIITINNLGVVSFEKITCKFFNNSKNIYQEQATFLKPVYFKNTVNFESNSINFESGLYPSNYQSELIINRLSDSTFSVNTCYCRDNLDSADIAIESLTTVDIETIGLNGLYQSADLTGVITVANGSPNILGTNTTFTTDFIVGDVITTNGGQSRRIITITDDLNIVVESNFTADETTVNYKRGGEAPNTWYNLYACSNDSTRSGQSYDSGYFLSTRQENLEIGLSDYEYFRQIPFSVKNNSSSNLENFYYRNGRVKYGGRSSLLSGGSATDYTELSFNNYAPSNVKFINLLITCTNTSASTSTDYTAYIRVKGLTDEFIVYQGKVESNYKNILELELPVGEENAIEYKCEVADLSLDIDIIGFTI